MPELESVLEKRLINQLCNGESQWTYRPDIKNEEQLWANFKYILEQNNKAKLNDTPLSESEFAKIKNDVSHNSFFDAGKWLMGEHGKVYVHIQRGNESLHLLVLNNEHICGGSSCYEVINQYQTFKQDRFSSTANESNSPERNRRFDVTLLINGIPLIHIELKNKDHSYIEGFNQIKKYIAEGKFRGLFSNVQMFIVSNAVDTKYFSAARDTELNKKFISGWLDEKNHPVCDYIDFADSVLRIPQAHEMVARYTMLDTDSQKLMLLRPYQIHAIEAMRTASKQGKSGFIWHTTGSGKTMTSYKAARNLLMDIPSIEKTIFLIDRKDLDTQTTIDFKSFAKHDTITVDDTDRVDTLIEKLSDRKKQLIVTTRQKIQILLRKSEKENNKKFDKMRKLKVAFVVDECHRTVTPKTKRKIERFFINSLWYGFTGTPIFEENKYEQAGDLPQTTEQLYGECLHPYTIKEAIHDEAVLGFMVENLGPRNKNLDESVFESETHMREVLDVILNKSYTKLGLQNSKGKTYEGMLTVNSIQKAQHYYDLLKKVKEGNDTLKINEEIHKAIPDFPKFAITYSVTENEEASQVNQEKMKQSLLDYNEMFGTNYTIDGIQAYNNNLNDRLARKKSKYLSRNEQLDLVIVVDRLLTGFNAPCLSTLFMDRQPLNPQNLIQAFSRTNRLLEPNKQFGQIVTFQSPDKYKEKINDALKLYSRGGEGKPVAEDWNTIRENFVIAVKTIHELAKTPEDIAALSRKQKKAFIHLFRALDNSLAHLKAFSNYTEDILPKFDFSEEEYEDYAAMYNNVMEELKKEPEESSSEAPVLDDYDLIAYNKLRIDFEYIIELLQGVVESLDQTKDNYNEADFEIKINLIRQMINEFAETRPKLAELLYQIVDEIAKNPESYIGKDISIIINQMRYEAINKEVDAFAKKWFIDPEAVKYEVFNYQEGHLSGENNLKDKADFTTYTETVPNPLPKFRFRKVLINEFKNNLIENISPLLD